MRTEFGFERTECACEECTQNCRFIPGYLIPDDLERLSGVLSFVDADDSFKLKEWATDFFKLKEWATEHLLASPGAIVIHNGEVKRVPTLVPARKEDGSCHWLTEDGRCSVHANAPFGCAFFDAHQTEDEYTPRSVAGIQSVIQSHQRCENYSMIWILLMGLGLKAPGPEDCREAMENRGS